MTHRVYLCGPMRGYPDLNKEAFTDAAAELRAAGMEVWNPHENESDWFSPVDRYKTVVTDLILVISWADEVFCLWGWERAVGCRAEVFAALFAENEVYAQAFDGDMRFTEPITSDTLSVWLRSRVIV